MINKGEKMSIPLSKVSAFQYKRELMFTSSEEEKKSIQKAGITNSVLAFAGYFPLVGAISGIARIIFAATSKGDHKASQIIRGVMEIACLGPVLFIVDAVGSCKAVIQGRI
jgi:hypothetical protein